MATRFVFPGIAILVAGLLAMPIARFAGLGPFKVGVELRRRPRMLLAGLTIRRTFPGGDIRVRGERAAGGHLSLGHLSLGPSTFLDLEGVEVTCSGPRGAWSAKAMSAALDGGRVEFRDGVVVSRDDGRRTESRRASISMETGSLTER